MRISDWSSYVCSSDLLANVRRVFQRRDLQLQRRIRIIFTRRNVLENGVEQWLHIAFTHGVFQARITFEARSVNDREIQLFVSSPQLVEQQIGRGTGRGRGCQSGEISGATGALK